MEDVSVAESTTSQTSQVPFGTRDGILKIDDTQFSEVDLNPEWPMRVRVRSMTVGERDIWENLATGKLSDDQSKRHFQGQKLGPQHTRAAVAYMCTLDGANGSARMFKPEDILVLARKHTAPLQKIFEEVIKISKVTENDIKEVEDALAVDPSSGPSTSLRKSSRSGTSRVGVEG